MIHSSNTKIVNATRKILATSELLDALKIKRQSDEVVKKDNLKKQRQQLFEVLDKLTDNLLSPEREQIKNNIQRSKKRDDKTEQISNYSTTQDTFDFNLLEEKEEGQTGHNNVSAYKPIEYDSKGKREFTLSMLKGLDGKLHDNQGDENQLSCFMENDTQIKKEDGLEKQLIQEFEDKINLLSVTEKQVKKDTKKIKGKYKVNLLSAKGNVKKYRKKDDRILFPDFVGKDDPVVKINFLISNENPLSSIT